MEEMMQQEIKPCPFCNSNAGMYQYDSHVQCFNQKCMLLGPTRDTHADGIRAWNQMALAFEIARADAIMECSGEVHIYNELSLANETAAHNAACDAHTRYRRAMDEWRQTDG